MAKSNFIVRGGLDMSSVTKGLQQTQKQFAQFQNKINSSMKAVTAIIGSIAIGDLIKDSVSSAMTVESSMTQLKRILGNNADAFNTWARTQSKALGMAREDAYKYGAVYGNLISGFATDTAETEQLTTQLLESSAIVASATGKTMEDVMERIRSGLLGNTEAIEDLGIYAQVGAIEATDAFKKIANGKSWEQLDYNTQQQIRLLSILEQATAKYGNTLAGTTATKQNAFLATLKNIRLNIGQAFLPIYNIVLPSLNALASKIENITSSLAKFSQVLFGTKAVTGVQTQTESVTELADATEAAGEAAKKATLPFDELNMINNNSSADTSTASTKTNTSDTKADDEINSITENLYDIKEKLQPTIDALEELMTVLEPFKENAGKGLQWFYDEVLVPVSELTITEVVPEFLYALTEAVNTINVAIEKFQSIGADDEIGGFINRLADAKLSGIAQYFTDIGDAFKNLSDFIEKPNFKSIAGYIAEVYNVVSNKSFNPDTNPITAFIRTITVSDLKKWYEEKIGPYLAKANWDDKLFKILEWVQGFKIGLASKLITWKDDVFSWFGDIKKKFENKGKDIALGIIDGWIGYNPILNTWLAGRINQIFVAFGDIKTKFMTKGYNIIDGIKEGWNSSWEAFASWLAFKPTSISYAFGALTEKFAVKGIQIISGIKNGWNDGWDSFKTWLGNLPSRIATGIGSLFDIGKNLMQTFINGLKSISLPKFKVSFGTSTASILGKSISIPTIDIGLFANGGLPDTGELFIANEAGPELVGRLGNQSAVANSDQIVDALASGIYAPVFNAVAAAMSRYSSGSDIYIDSELFTRATNNGRSRNDRRQNTVLQTV